MHFLLFGRDGILKSVRNPLNVYEIHIPKLTLEQGITCQVIPLGWVEEFRAHICNLIMPKDPKVI